MVDGQPVGGFLEVLDLLLEVAVAAEVDLVELVLVDEVLSHLLQVVVCCPVELGRVSEQQGTLLEGKGAYLAYLVRPLYLLYGTVEKGVDYLLRLEPGLLP